MNDQVERARRFRELHQRGNPVILFNAWDAGSAKAVAEAGAKAIATGSWSVAAADGYEDGEKIPLAVALANLERIVGSVELPVTFDLETGYGDIANAVRQAVAAGAIGFNYEDGRIGEEGLYPIDEQSARIRAARAAADAQIKGVFINARTDMFLRAEASTHSDEMVEEALRRADAYAQAGADGLFVPGLADPAKIARICEKSPLPVNIMGRPGVTKPSELARLGVARISYGPFPYRLAMEALKRAAAEAMVAMT
jgi:2-methylisocitrate lyase-like PEP mutase family enzyme